MASVDCKDCGITFDNKSPQKKKVGGYANQCPECSEEHAVKYIGFQAADGKQSQAQILKFEDEQSKEKYKAYYQASNGLYKGKSCQLSKSLPAHPNVKFKTVISFSPMNHKGKSNG